MKFQIPTPINPHGHLRNGEWSKHLARKASLHYSTYLAMPNTQPGIFTGSEAVEYKNMLESACEGKMRIIPTIKITENTTPKMIRDAVKLGVKFGKFYPKGRTTNAEDGVYNYIKLWPVLEEMEECGMTSLFHPTHPTESFEGRDAEFAFLSIFWMIRENFPMLRMTWEHLSDARCIPHLKAMQKNYRNTFVTITAHHLCGNEDKHHGDVSATCQPPIRAERDRTDLIKFVMENHEWVMGGLDDAPHPIEKKHVIGRCACGAYTTEAGTLLYATALNEFGLFSRDDGFTTFQSFVSSNAAKYLYVSESESMREIANTSWTIPEKYDFNGISVIPFWGGKTLPFSYT